MLTVNGSPLARRPCFVRALGNSMCLCVYRNSIICVLYVPYVLPTGLVASCSPLARRPCLLRLHVPAHISIYGEPNCTAHSLVVHAHASMHPSPHFPQHTHTRTSTHTCTRTHARMHAQDKQEVWVKLKGGRAVELRQENAVQVGRGRICMCVCVRACVCVCVVCASTWDVCVRACVSGECEHACVG